MKYISLTVFAALTFLACKKETTTNNRLGKWNYNQTLTTTVSDSTVDSSFTVTHPGSFEFKADGMVRRVLYNQNFIDYKYQDNGTNIILTNYSDTMEFSKTTTASFSETWVRNWTDSTASYVEEFKLSK